MKHNIFRLASALLLALALLCVPAFADAAGDAAYAEPEHYVLDLAGLLSAGERTALETDAAEVSAQYGCGVYTVTLDDYSGYGSTVETVVEDVYHELEIGDGIILLLSMEGRDFATFVKGERAEHAFSDYALRRLEEGFLDNFADDDWYGGFSDYQETCGRYLALAESGKPVRANPWPGVALAVAIALVVALVICLVLKSKMKSVHRKAEASAYVTAAGLTLTAQEDRYTHTTETRSKLGSEKAEGASGGFSGSDGGHGRSGKF